MSAAEEYGDRVVGLLIRVFQSKAATAHEEAFETLGALANGAVRACRRAHPPPPTRVVTPPSPSPLRTQR